MLSAYFDLSNPMKSLNAIDQELRRPFVNFIDSLSKQHIENMDWWCSELAARSTLARSLYADCLKLFQIKNRITADKNFHITLNDKALYRTLLKNLETHHLSQVHYKKKLISSFKKIPLHWLRYGNLIYQISKRFLAAKFIPNPKPLPNQPLTLIDMFILSHSFDDQNQYKDRYYGRLKEFLTPEEKKLFFYVPTFQTSPHQTISIIKKCRQSPDNFLLPEDFLKLSDLFYIWTYPFRAWKFFPTKKYTLLDLDISSLVIKHWWQGLTYGSTYEGLLKYRFVKRLKERNIPIRLVIDWFENQSIDKGQNAGFRKFYPNTLIIGYQGFIIPDNFSYISPSRIEAQAQVIPQEISVCGEALVSPRKEFSPMLQVTIGPAFRFEHIFSGAPCIVKKTNIKVIFIGLPITTSACIQILQLLGSLKTEMFPYPVKFIIKSHPTVSNAKTLIKKTLPQDFKYFIEPRNTSECAAEVDLLISNSSSLVCEFLALGIPVIITTSSEEVTQNPIPPAVNTKIWQLANSPETLLDAIKKLLTVDKNILSEQGTKTKEICFSSVDSSSARSFLNLA